MTHSGLNREGKIDMQTPQRRKIAIQVLAMATMAPAMITFLFGESLWKPRYAPNLFALAAAPAESTKSREALEALIRRANQEGELIATVQSSWSKASLQPLGDAFKKSLGLNIKVTISTVRSAQHFPVAIAETQARAPATYDVVQGDDAEMMQLIGAGGIQRIDNADALLSAVNGAVRGGKVRREQISSGPFHQLAFLLNANVKQIVYNPKLITEAELPKIHADLADAKYKGKFTQPPWTAHWEIAPAVFDNFDKDKWLDVVRSAGKNTAAILPETTGVQRVALGEFTFALAQDAYFRQVLAQDAKAPLAFKYFEDYNERNSVYYGVRSGARHPAAATLFALWITTAEAQGIWQSSEFSAVPHGESKIDQEHRLAIQNAKAKVLGFLENQKTIDLLKWYQTEEGRKYLDGMTRAIRGE
jgi:ABC-type Fe3+ transport system substrate-binding protein